MWEHACGFEEEQGECVRSGAGKEVREVRGEPITQASTGHSKNTDSELSKREPLEDSEQRWP